MRAATSQRHYNFVIEVEGYHLPLIGDAQVVEIDEGSLGDVVACGIRKMHLDDVMTVLD